MSKKALVLSSGGVDSTTCIGIAVERLGKENVSTVSVFYGQKHSKELECAEKIADYYEVDHYVLDLSNVFKYSDCPLLESSSRDIPDGSYDEQIGRNENGMVATYVPYRNGLMLSAVTSLAVSLHPDDDVDIYLGAHADDAAGSAYADCSEDFTDSIGEAISIGTYDRVHLVAPLVKYNKAQVVAEGLDLHVPYELTWSCYKGGDKACGKCGTCIDRLKAFEVNGVEDLIEYEVV